MKFFKRKICISDLCIVWETSWKLIPRLATVNINRPLRHNWDISCQRALPALLLCSIVWIKLLWIFVCIFFILWEFTSFETLLIILRSRVEGIKFGDVMLHRKNLLAVNKIKNRLCTVNTVLVCGYQKSYKMYLNR